MSTTYTTTSSNGVVLSVTIPELVDTANIVTAFQSFSSSLATTLEQVESNVVPTSGTNGKVTITNTSANAYSAAGRIFVQSAQPSNPVTGDIWMW